MHVLLTACNQVGKLFDLCLHIPTVNLVNNVRSLYLLKGLLLHEQALSFGLAHVVVLDGVGLLEDRLHHLYSSVMGLPA